MSVHERWPELVEGGEVARGPLAMKGARVSRCRFEFVLDVFFFALLTREYRLVAVEIALGSCVVNCERALSMGGGAQRMYDFLRFSSSNVTVLSGISCTVPGFLFD